MRVGEANDWMMAASGLAPGWGHTVALKTDGSLWAWGSNGEGELGNGGAWSITPVRVLIGPVGDASAWLPAIDLASVAVMPPGHFGFKMIWGSGRSVIVERCLDLSNPCWTPVSTNLIVDGRSQFTESRETVGARFYRIVPE